VANRNLKPGHKEHLCGCLCLLRTAAGNNSLRASRARPVNYYPRPKNL